MLHKAERKMKKIGNEMGQSTTLRPLSLHLCGHEQCKPGHSFGPAIRNHYLIHFVLHGKGCFFVDGTTYTIGSSQGFLILPGITTRYVADEEDPWEYVWIGFDGYDAPTILNHCGLSAGSLLFTDHGSGLLWEDIMVLNHMLGDRNANEFAYLGQLYKCFSHMHLPPEASPRILYEEHVRTAMEYIHNNYSYEITISDIAKYLHIDRTYLFKIFKNYMNTSPQKYLIHYRLEVARTLLSDTILPVTEVAFSCGFRNASSFDKHFKTQFQLSPRQFRQNESLSKSELK